MGGAHPTVQASSIDRARAFRDCVGSFATGVTIVTAQQGGRRAGMTANSFTSVSLDPLLVLVSLAHGSRTLDAVRGDGRFTVSVLRREQERVALAFAKPDAPFPHEEVVDDGEGYVPVAGALAVIRCAVHTVVTAGDHDLVVGNVHAFDQDDGEPLVFWRGRFGDFWPSVATG